MKKSDSDEQKKVVSFFQEKIGVTPSVAALGYTNPSDGTEYISVLSDSRITIE